jgi:uncharacterized membrane protein YdbT with pleckstrin-like domain
MNQLNPGVKWIFRLNTYSRFGGLLILSIYFIFFFSFGTDGLFLKDIFGNYWFIFLLSSLLFIVIFIIVIGEIYARMSYKRYLYEITNEEVKIEHGIIWKRYISIPYERVQNVEIRRGIIARMLGFSTVDIETAGQSGFGNSSGFGRRGNQRYKSEGHLPAVDIEGAEKIRDFVMKKIKRVRSGAGLG